MTFPRDHLQSIVGKKTKKAGGSGLLYPKNQWAQTDESNLHQGPVHTHEFLRWDTVGFV